MLSLEQPRSNIVHFNRMMIVQHQEIKIAVAKSSTGQAEALPFDFINSISDIVKFEGENIILCVIQRM